MFNGESVTYAEVGRRAAAVQEALVGAGVKAGDKVALLSSSMPNWGICYLAVTSAGMVAVPILPDLSGPRIWGSSPSMSRQRDLRRFLRPTTWRRSSIRRERRRAPRA